MKKVFISQPMSNLTDEEVFNTRARVTKYLEEMDFEVIDSWIREDGNPVYLLGRSIELLSQADKIYLVKGWKDSRGCRIEYEVAKAYNIDIMEEMN